MNGLEMIGRVAENDIYPEGNLEQPYSAAVGFPGVQLPNVVRRSI